MYFKTLIVAEKQDFLERMRKGTMKEPKKVSEKDMKSKRELNGHARQIEKTFKKKTKQVQKQIQQQVSQNERVRRSADPVVSIFTLNKAQREILRD